MYMKGMEQRPRGAATMYTTTDTSGTHSSSANPTISVDTLENILKPAQVTLDYILNLIVTDKSVNKIIIFLGLGL